MARHILFRTEHQVFCHCRQHCHPPSQLLSEKFLQASSGSPHLQQCRDAPNRFYLPRRWSCQGHCLHKVTYHRMLTHGTVRKRIDDHCNDRSMDSDARPCRVSFPVEKLKIFQELPYSWRGSWYRESPTPF